MVGHGGRERTIRIIKERTIDKEDHKFLDRDVGLFIRYCALCQMMAIKTLKAKILPLRIDCNYVNINFIPTSIMEGKCGSF